MINFLLRWHWQVYTNNDFFFFFIDPITLFGYEGVTHVAYDMGNSSPGLQLVWIQFSF